MPINLLKVAATSVLLSLVAIVPLAQAQSVEAGPPAAILAKTYDVRSLCMDVPDYPLPSSMLSSEDRTAARDRQRGQDPEGASVLSPTAIIKLIETTVAPESWRDSGGTQGSVSDFQGMLIISQTETNHQKIADL